MKIGSFELGQGIPYIVAEVGSNWHTLADCRHAIHEAARCGANAVKFQLFSHYELYGLPEPSEGWPMSPYCLPPEWLSELKYESDKANIDFMCTAFSPEGIEKVDPFVVAHKIASTDCGHRDMLEVAFGTGKPVIVSTGGASADDIWLLHGLTPKLVMLYCVANYPAINVDLRYISELRKLGFIAGYSDHTTSWDRIPFDACHGYGAQVLEKHFTALPDLNTPDGPHSLNPATFKAMVDLIRTPVLAWGENPAEVEFRQWHKRRPTGNGFYRLKKP
jgi:sialic acid synthase SpsE